MSNQLPAPALPARCRFQDCGHEELQDVDLYQHIATAHGHRPFVCIVCGRMVNSASSLARHTASHKNAGRFACFLPNCGRAYARRDELGNHLLRSHEDDLRNGINLLYSMNLPQVQKNPPQVQQNPPQVQQNPPQAQWNANLPQEQWDANQGI